MSIQKGLSLEVLTTINNSFDAIFLDGDHNWYTVYEELTIIETRKLLRSGGIIFLHDIRWPYARRDMYYQPEVIPSEFVHPFEKKGIEKGQSKLSNTSNFHSGLNNAIKEGGARNGVLTAIEDFLKQTDKKYWFLKSYLEYGLGMIIYRTEKQGGLYKFKLLYRIRLFEISRLISIWKYRGSAYLEQNVPILYKVVKLLHG